MTKLRPYLFALMIAAGCQPKAVIDEGTITETSTNPPEEATAPVEDPPDPPADSGTPPTPDVGPVGSWSTCNGTLTRDAERFSWDGNLSPCAIEGETSFEDGILTLHPNDFDDCERLPWWIGIFESENPSYASIQNGTRLALLPTIPTESARVLNLEEALVIEEWELVNEEDLRSAFKLCWTVTGEFFEGRYLGVDTCDFLSCGGVVTQLVMGDEGEEHLTTQCAGTCPCGGIVTVEERTESTLSGRYNAANCARLMEGRFTATPLAE